VSDRWYTFDNVDEVASPALLVYPPRVEENLRRMIAMAGGAARLRPHIKTHKMAEVIQLELDAGIDKIKCATVAEAELAARTGAPDVLLAYQPVGPAGQRLCRLAQAYPATRFSTIADDAGAIRALSRTLDAHGLTMDVLLDIDNGMHRSGVAPGPQAAGLYRLLADLPGVRPGGLHVYDGHIRDADLDERARHVEADFEAVDALREDLLATGLPVPCVVAGGTPTFPVHARRNDRQCSPGTCVFWDAGYGGKFRDLDFLPAALVMTRVISKPGGDRLCLDLGYKAVAADSPPPRAELLELPDARFLGQNEEHLVIETDQAADFAVGDVLFAVPFHICPTCAMYREALVVNDRWARGHWPVAARDRMLSI
jgi:D-serine deaminase-like pyridoxal phosphate-dependent protein